MEWITGLISAVYQLLWGDLFVLPLPGRGTLGISLLVILLIPTGIYFTIRTRFLPIRLFPEMLRVTAEKRGRGKKNDAISGVQALVVSTATRVGMGNLVGVVAAISAGGAGAVFWMWLSALVGSSTAFIEATLAQLYRQKDPLYGGYRGGPAYYIHAFETRRRPGKRRRTLIATLFCHFRPDLLVWNQPGCQQFVTSAFENAFEIPPLWTTVVLVVLAALIVLRKNATVKVLDVLVPIMAVCYFVMTIVLIIKNAAVLPSVFQRIF